MESRAYFADLRPYWLTSVQGFNYFYSTGVFYRENPVLTFYLLSSQLCLIIYYFGNRDSCVDGFKQNAIKSLF